MAELKASELKYGAPLITKLGGVLFTATTVETPSSAEYQEVGSEKGLELNLEKLGLTDNAILGAVSVAGPEGGVGGNATTTSLPIAAWSTPIMTATTASKNELEIVCFATAVTIGAGKVYLRIFATPTAGAEKPMLEPKTSQKATISLCQCTIFCLGK